MKKPIFQSIPAMFLSTTEHYPQRIGLKYFEKDVITTCNFTQYKERVFNLAAGMISVGIQPRSHISLLSETRYEWCISDMAILSCNAVSVTLFPTLDFDQVRFIVEDSESVGIMVSNSQQLEKVLKSWHKLPKLNYCFTIEQIPNVEELLTKNLAPDLQTTKSTFLTRIISSADLMKRGSVLLQEKPTLITDLIGQIHENDMATIIYTSGTTGIPKGVMLSHRNFISDAVMGSLAVSMYDDERSTTYLPLAHSFAHTVEFIGGTLKGAMLCFAKNYASLVDNIHDFQPTSMIGVPLVFEQIYRKATETVNKLPPNKQKLFWGGIELGKKICDLEQEHKPVPFMWRSKHKFYKKVVFKSIRVKLGGKLRRFVSGGAAFNPEINKFFYAAGVRILEGFGLTESAPITHVNREDFAYHVHPASKIGTIGPPIGDHPDNPYPRVEQKLSPEGELLVRGPNIMLGYWKRPEETAQALDAEGWLHTGDLATIDEDGYAKIIGRAKHIIVLRTGKKIAPNFVEPIYCENLHIGQILLLGEGEKFISALIVPNFEYKNQILQQMNLSNINDVEFCKHADVIAFFEDQLKQSSKGRLADYETIKKFVLIPEPWTEENHMLTPSMKIKKEKVIQKYGSVIQEIYHS